MSEKFILEQKVQIVIESFTPQTLQNCAGDIVFPLHSSTDGKNDFLKLEREG
ncbi:MAG: hypothetical protein QW292_12295 [Candidatus Parvarchaeota archaeon]